MKLLLPVSQNRDIYVRSKNSDLPDRLKRHFFFLLAPKGNAKDKRMLSQGPQFSKIFLTNFKQFILEWFLVFILHIVF